MVFADWWREQWRLTQVNENEVDDERALQGHDLHEMLVYVVKVSHKGEQLLLRKIGEQVLIRQIHPYRAFLDSVRFT